MHRSTPRTGSAPSTSRRTTQHHQAATRNCFFDTLLATISTSVEELLTKRRKTYTVRVGKKSKDERVDTLLKQHVPTQATCCPAASTRSTLNFNSCHDGELDRYPARVTERGKKILHYSNYIPSWSSAVRLTYEESENNR